MSNKIPRNQPPMTKCSYIIKNEKVKLIQSIHSSRRLPAIILNCDAVANSQKFID